MPVGTLATVKALDPGELRAAGAQMHPRQRLSSAPPPRRRGDSRPRRPAPVHGVGRTHRSPTPADSRSSRSRRCARVDEDGVEFKSHIDGSRRRFTPESVMRIEHEPRRRRDHAVRPRRSRTIEPRCRTGRGGAQHSLAGTLPRCVRPAPRLASAGGASAVPHRPGRHPRRRCARRRPRRSPRWRPGPATGSAACRSAKPSPTCTQMIDAVDAVAPPRSAAVPDGRRFPGRPPRGHRSEASTSSTASRRPGWDATAPRLPAPAASMSGAPIFATTRARSTRHVRLLDLHPFLARLHPAPVRRRRDAGPAPSLPAQCTFPHVARPLRARGHRGRDSRSPPHHPTARRPSA